MYNGVLGMHLGKRRVALFSSFKTIPISYGVTRCICTVRDYMH